MKDTDDIVLNFLKKYSHKHHTVRSMSYYLGLKAGSVLRSIERISRDHDIHVITDTSQRKYRWMEDGN